MINHPVPFVANTADNRHCYQACLAMLWGYFFPDRAVSSWAELDAITHISHHYTWPYAGDLWLQSQGLAVAYIERFDHARFTAEGGAYLYEHVGPEVAANQIANSDIPAEQARARLVVERISQEHRIPTVADITTALTDNALVLCNVNAYALLGQAGYEGHMVLVKGYTETALIIHDPGLPARAELTIPLADFEAAWAYPDEQAKNMTTYQKV